MYIYKSDDPMSPLKRMKKEPENNEELMYIYICIYIYKLDDPTSMSPLKKMKKEPENNEDLKPDSGVLGMSASARPRRYFL
jgi:hypothetical protein